MRDMTMNGSLNASRSVGLTKDFADSIGVGIGDPVRAVVQYNETLRWTANLTVTALLQRSSSSGSTGPSYCRPYPPFLCFYGYFAIVNLRDVNWLLAALNQTQPSFGYQFSGEVWIDRAHYVNPYDLDATEKNLLRIQRRLDAVLGPGTYVSDNILAGIEGFQAQIGIQRVQYLILSSPVILLGVYLGAVGVDLSHAERRRELAVFKTRGAGRGQLVGLLLLEAVVGGLVAAVVSLIAGVGRSRLLLIAVNPNVSSLPYEAFILTPNTVVTVALLGIALMGAVEYRSAKRTAGLPIVETLRYYAPGETKILYNPRTDIVLIGIGIADYVLVWWRTTGPLDLWTFLLGFVPFLLLPFVPLLLIVGITRILTRSTGKVYDWFSRAAKPFTKELHFVIRRNLMRNPRRSANIAIIIALGLAFGVFSLSLLATNAAHLEREVRANVGADLAVYSFYDSTTPTDTVANLTAIPGIAGATPITGVGILGQYSNPSVYALDPDSYFAVAQPESWYFDAGSTQSGHDVLAQRGYALISRTFADQNAYLVGDRIRLFAYVSVNGTFQDTIQDNVTVGGFVNRLPGVGYGSEQAIYASVETLRAFLGPNPSRNFGHTNLFLADLAPGADWRTVKDAVLQSRNVSSVVVAQEQIDQQTTNPFARAFYGFIAMEIAFIVVILTAGVGLILYAASLERDVEFAALIARGSSGWQTAKLLVGEAFVIMLVGLTIGVGVGLGTAFFATQWLALGPTGVPTSPVPYFFVFPLDAFLLVVLGPAAMLLAAFLVSARVARINVAKVLKLRGG